MNLVTIINSTGLIQEIKNISVHISFHIQINKSKQMRVRILTKESDVYIQYIDNYKDDYESMRKSLGLPESTFLEFFDACVSLYSEQYDLRNTMKIRNVIDTKLNPKLRDYLPW